MSQKDLIIGAYTNYNWDKIKYWANSIDQSGFTGDKAVIVYNSDQDTVKKLSDLGFKVWAFGRDASGNFVWPSSSQLVIVVDRFLHLWNYLDNLPENYYRFVITTDVKDVVFQKNPSDWLENNIGDKELVASCESLRYKHEPWGDDNLKGSYPMVWNKMKEKAIWNCGVQAGRMQAIKDLWLQIYLMSKAGQRLNPDQAAYNILLNSRSWSLITKFLMSETGWACQAGTTVDPAKIENFRPHLLEPEPRWSDSLSKTSTGITHVILHQWDRIPAWQQEIEKKYG
jgi:hypothetical protein